MSCVTSPDATSSPTLVHVAGPIEPESVGARRRQRQRCLRCDTLLWDERAIAQPFLLGDPVVGRDGAGGWSWVATHRAKLNADERACRAP